MVLNTATVSLAVAPAVVATFVRHYLDRKSRRQKPTADISYDEGLHLIRQFLRFASTQRVEDLQRFTTQWVPSPRWVKVDVVPIPPAHIAAAAETLHAQLGPQGIELVGGKTWWQWRRPGSELHAEWIEMRSDHTARKRAGDAGRRVMLYVHGGAYFFGSVDEHRYQLQRHARKLKARLFARTLDQRPMWRDRAWLMQIARYRLAPQFPFPCALHDCLAAYLYLLTVQDASTIVLAGDSAGGGMVVSLLVTIRDRGIPPPAGAILISPWVDLTHSFPSVADENPLDFIPSQGFHSRPSPAWPPPSDDERAEAARRRDDGQCRPGTTRPGARAAVSDSAESATSGGYANVNGANGGARTMVPGCGLGLSMELDGRVEPISDQIQMYATNSLIAHPLVSPIVQASLGGLPPLLILTGGGEVLRDEQVYLAHKAASPSRFPPADLFLDAHQHHDHVHRWKPTDVQLQVWDDLCHVAPTLSFTRPAKYMYRSIAQFGAWALARAQQTEIDIVDDDDVSVISGSESEVESPACIKDLDSGRTPLRVRAGQIGKAGDPLPPFRNHMIRQRVDRNGNIYPLEPASQLPACNLPPAEIGVIKEGPVRKWIMAKREWDTKFASSRRQVQEDRAKEMAEGKQMFGDGEVPPPSALAGRWRKGNQDRAEKSKRSWGMSLWSSWGSKHDKETVQREQQADKPVESVVVTGADGANARPLDDTENSRGKAANSTARKSRSRSRRRTVTDEGQTEQAGERDENTSVIDILATRKPDTQTIQDDKAREEKKEAKQHEEQKEVKREETQPAEEKEGGKRVDTKEEVKDQKAKSEDDEIRDWFQNSEALNAETLTAKAASEQPVVVKKPEMERMRPDSSVLGVRLVTESAPEARNFNFAFSSEKVVPAKAKDEGLDLNFGLLKSPTMPLSPSTDKAGDEGLRKYDSKSPVDKLSFDKSRSKFSFDQSAAKSSMDKAEAEGLIPPPTPTIVEPSPPAVEESTSNPKTARRKSSFASSLKRALTKRSANTVTSNNSLTIPVGGDTRVTKSSGSNRETNWKAFEANGSLDKAYESGVGVKKSLSTREPRRAPLAKTTTWKAEEAGSGGLRARPSVSKRPLPMLKKDYVPPPTTLKSLESMAEDDELPKPGLQKARDPDAISDYLTW